MSVSPFGAARDVASLLETHRRELTAFVQAMVGGDRAEDIVQDAYLRLSRAELPGIIHNPKAYLFRAAANLARDELRRRQRQTQGLQGLPPIAHSPAASEVILVRERLERLRMAVNQLPAKCRRVFVLRKFEELSYADIARQEGISEKTVENHIARALKLIRHYLDDEA